MDNNKSIQKAQDYLNTVCNVSPNRRVGSPGNKIATDYVSETMKRWGYTIETEPFSCLDFKTGEVSLTGAGQSYDITTSPFSLGCDVEAELVTVTTVEELEQCSCKDKILLLKGPICAEQLMPKNFVFYNPEHHKRIYALLEEKQPAAIITATGKNPDLAGSVYPFPMIEDGDFDIPSVYCKDVTGEELALGTGEWFYLKSEATRIPTTACNVIARKNPETDQKIVVCAHIDAKENTPGALDNATGIVIQLLLAEMLAEYEGGMGIEIIAFNGEDYYSAGGQMDYLHRYAKELEKIAVAINIDGAGYINGKSAYSLYQCPEEIEQKARSAFGACEGTMEGEQWYQGDHMIFVQNNRPAIAVTIENFAELCTEISHTPKDSPELVDYSKLVEVAQALKDLIETFLFGSRK